MNTMNTMNIYSSLKIKKKELTTNLEKGESIGKETFNKIFKRGSAWLERGVLFKKRGMKLWAWVSTWALGLRSLGDRGLDPDKSMFY